MVDSLADDAIAALANPKRGMVARNSAIYRSSGLKRRAAQLYNNMRQATRFILDDDFVDFAMETSMRSNLVDLVDQYKLFRLPHDNVWIEWDEVRRQKTLERMADEFGLGSSVKWAEIAPRVGYLLNASPYNGYQHESYIATPINTFHDTGQKLQINPHETVEVPKHYDGKVAVSPLSIQFATMQEGSGFTLEHHRHFLKDFLGDGVPIDEDAVDAARKAEANATIECLGHWWGQRNAVGTDFEDTPEDGKSAGNALYDLVAHHRLIQGPGVDFFVDMDTTQWTTEEGERMRQAGLEMTRGDSRFLITVMGMLNFDWVVKTPREAAGRRYKFGKFRKGDSHIEVAIDLPKFHGITITPKGFGAMNETSRRQHSVRGHWRRYRDGRRVWITAHLRGDPKLGIITKDYRLQHRRKT